MSYSQQRNKRIREIFESLSQKDQRILEGMVATFDVPHIGIVKFLDLLISLWMNDETRRALERGEFGRDTVKGEGR